MLSAHLELRGIQRWLVDSPIPTLQRVEAEKMPLHGELECEAGRRMPRMLTHFQLSLRWLQYYLSVWKHLDLRALSHVGEGCFPNELLADLNTLRNTTQANIVSARLEVPTYRV